MLKVLQKAVAIAAITLTPSLVAAEPPVLASYSPGSFFLGANDADFQVQFLFGRASQSNALFYQVGGGAWTFLFQLNGTSNPTVPSGSPAGFNPPMTVNVGASGVAREVRFAICDNPAGQSFAACGLNGQNGPYFSGVGATNVRNPTADQWNAMLPITGAIAARTDLGINLVFGFEDSPTATTDNDFSDVVFGTDLGVVPEPSTYALMAAGLVAVGAVARRRRNNA